MASHPMGARNYYDPVLTVTGDGTLHAVYYYSHAYDTTREYSIKYASSSDNGATWSASTYLTTASSKDDLRQPTIVTDANGTVHMFYLREDNLALSKANLYHTSKAAGSTSWTPAEQIAANVAGAISVASDGAGKFAVGYQDTTVDANWRPTSTTLHIVTNQGNSWTDDASLSYQKGAAIAGLQYAAGKLHMLVQYTATDASESSFSVLRKDGGAWSKGYEGELSMPSLTLGGGDKFDQGTFIVSPTGQVIVVAESGQLKVLEFTSGSEGDFGLPNAAPVLSGLDGDEVVFTAGAADPAIDQAYIDFYDGPGAQMFDVYEADGGDFNGGGLAITRTAGKTDGRLVIDFAGGVVGAGPDAQSLGGALHAGDRIFINLGTWTEIGRVHALMDGQDGRDLVITFTSAFADAGTTKTLVSYLMYTAPTAGARVFSLTVNDGDGGASTPAVFTMTGIDTVPPTVTGISASTANGARKLGDTVSIQVSFSEAVHVTGAPTLLLETGTSDRSAILTGGNGSNTLTFTYTVQAGDLAADLDVAAGGALQLNGGSIRDEAGNEADLALAALGAPGSLGANKAIRVDGSAPFAITLDKASVSTQGGAHAEVGMLSSADTTPQDSFIYSLVAGAGADDNAAFEIIGGVLRAIDAAALAEGSKSVRVRTADAAGNSFEEALAITVTTPPTVAISASPSSLGVDGSALITFTFTDAPVGFEEGDITVSGGTLGALSVDPLNPKVYTATFTPAAGQQNLAATISVGAGTFADADGLDNTASTSNAVIGGDTLAPSVVIGSSQATFKAGETATITFTFSETPAGFSDADIVATGGSLGPLTATANPKVYTAAFTPTADTDSLSGAIGIAAGTFADAQGNANTAADSLLLAGDTRSPTVSDAHIAISGATGRNGSFIAGDTITATWDDSASGDNNAATSSASVDFSAFGGPAVVAATRSGGVWSASWQLAAGALDATGRNVTVTARDATGNSGSATDGSNASVDTQAPTLSGAAIAVAGASGNGGVYRVGDIVTASWDNTAGANPDVAGVQFDFSSFGGGLVAGTDSGGSWSASYTIAQADIDAGNRQVAVAVTDDAGNRTAQSSPSGVQVDAILPHIRAITVAGTPGPDATAIDYTVVFDEAVTGVDLADFALVAGGSATGTLAGISGSGTTWTVNVTGIGGSGSLRLDLNGSGTGIEDGAGNAAAAGYTAGNAHTVSFNAAPLIGSNGGGASASIGVAEKQRAVTTVTASDADGQALGYAIDGGADAALFEIDAATGVLRFIAAPHLGTALDSDQDNVYEVNVTVRDAEGGQDSQALSVTVQGDLDGDGTPDVADTDADNDGGPNSVEDNVPGARGVAGDGNGDGIADGAQLNVASLPTIVAGAPYATLEVAPGLSLSAVASTPAASGLPRNVKMPVGQFDFTIGGVAPGGTAQMSIYVDTAQKVNGYYKKDASGNWVNLATSVTTVGSKTKVTFSLTDGGQYDDDGVVNGSISDPGGLVTIAPAITSNGGQPSASLSVTEGAAGVTTVQAGPGASYAITGGADAALFQIDAATGVLRFVNAPAHGSPLDAGADNVYEVSVTASDTFGCDTQALAVRVTATPPAPPPPPPTVVVDGVDVGTGTRGNSDGSTSQVISIPVIQPTRDETVGNNDVADIPLVSSGGTPVLSAQVPVGIGLQVTGNAAPTNAADALTNLIREIKGVTVAGSHDQGQMTGGGSGFLSSIPSGANLLVQTVVPTVAPGTAAAGPLVIQGAAQGAGGPLSALVIDAKGLASGSVIQLQNVDFAAIVGSVTVNGGNGSQTVWGDGASQTIFLGADDDILHGGAGDDVVGSAGGNDRIYGDEGNDVVFGGIGDDRVDGGAGLDTVQLAGSGRADYTARFDNGQLVLTHRNGGADGSDVIANVEVLRFTDAAADTSLRGSVARLYEAVLGREADLGGLAAWTGGAEKGLALNEVARAMLSSAEAAQQPAASDADFVRALYARTLERAADSEGLAFWTGLLGSAHLDRAGVALAFADSSEKLAKPVTQEVDVAETDIGTLVRMYASLFDRTADSSGISFWLSLSEAGMSMDTIADYFVASTEAQAMYGALDNRAFTEALYQHAMHRTASQDEVGFWTGMLDSGRLDRGDVLLQFAESTEKVALVGTISTSLDGAAPV
ncbi:MAG: Ig-like domain-containing protein [Pseudomonadota bacterium]